MSMYNPTVIMKIGNSLKEAFPYCELNDENNSYRNSIFQSAQVGISDTHNVLIRINFERVENTNNAILITFGVVDDERNQFLYNTVDDLKTKVSEILKKRIDEESKARRDAAKVDLIAMKLCGFLTKHDLTFSTENSTGCVIVNIFGTAFNKLSISIYKNNPDVYVIPMPRASLTQEQLEKFILTCKSLKE